MTSLLERWPIVVAVVLAVILVTLAIHRLRGPDPDEVMRRRLEHDAIDPFKGWVQAAFVIVTGGCDYGHLPRAEARRILQDWWEVHGPGEHARALRGLAHADRPDNAWDLLRFVLVARLGVGAGYLDDSDSWERIRPVAIRLQAAYSSWRALAQAYVMARRQWRELPADGSADDPEMLRILENIVGLHGAAGPRCPTARPRRGGRLTVRHGDLILARFDAVAPRGDAIATASADVPLYVAGVIPGELAEVRILRIKPHCAAAEIVRLVEPAPDRVEPRCSLFGSCNGCQLQHVAYPHQLELKREMVRAQLRRFGGFEDPPVNPVIGAEHPYAYRNHARFTVDGGRLGFVRRFRRKFFEVPACLIMEPRINALLARLQGRIHETTQCNVRVGADPDDVTIQPALPLDDPPSGQPHLHEALLGRRFRVSTPSFFQVNRAQAERMIEVLRERIGSDPAATVVDAYAGVGTFAALLAGRIGRMIAIEESGPATAMPRSTSPGCPASSSAPAGPRICCRARGPGPRDDPRPTAVGLPPRGPAGRARAGPRADPLCLVRPGDPRPGPRRPARGPLPPRAIQPLDMFPQTHHVECIATLDRDEAPAP